MRTGAVRQLSSTLVVRALVLAAAAALVAGCGGADPASGSEGGNQVVAVALSAHRGMLTVRSRDPEATGEDVVAAFVEETLIEQVEAAYGSDGSIELVAAFGMEEVDADGTYGDEVLGACVRITATAGRADGALGERGRVTTEQVTCPDTLTPERSGRPADRIVSDLPAMADDVPLPREEPGACFGTTGDCPGG